MLDMTTFDFIEFSSLSFSTDGVRIDLGNTSLYDKMDKKYSWQIDEEYDWDDSYRF